MRRIAEAPFDTEGSSSGKSLPRFRLLDKLEQRLFPSCSRFERRRKMALLLLALLGVLLLTAATAFLIVRVSS